MNGIRKLKRPLMATGIAGAIFSYAQVHKVNQKLDYIKDKLESNGKEPIMELTTRESANFPWEFDPMSLEKEDWEFRRVRVKGGLFATRHLVRRDKGNRPGYLVFGAMPTAQHTVKDIEIPSISEANIGAQTGIVVCLGWIPMEAKEKAIGDFMVQSDVVLLDELYQNSKFIPKSRYQDPFTGFIYETAIADDKNIPIKDPFDDSSNPELRKARVVLGEALYPSSDDPDARPFIEKLPANSEMTHWGKSRLPSYEGYYHMRGYLRKGEDTDYLFGRYNDDLRNVNKVDIVKIAGFYRFRNPSAYEYYIERSTDDEEEYKNLLPQPNHLNKGFEHLEPFEKDSYYNGYNYMMKLSSVLTILGLLI